MRPNTRLCLFALIIGGVLADDFGDEGGEGEDGEGSTPSTTTTTTTGNEAIPASGTACTSKITFPIKALTGLTGYPWMAEVFGIKVVATNKAKGKIQHVASVLAELLDNDSDGCADDPNVLKNLLSGTQIHGYKNRKYVIFLELPGPDQKNPGVIGKNWTKKAAKAGYIAGQQLALDEILPKCAAKYTDACRDASQEELMHFINGAHAKVYPKIFGLGWGIKSDLNKAMDKARGGKLKKTPATQAAYPKNAWYRYADTTCDYECQPIEYLWWGYCAYSGLGNGFTSGGAFGQEFKLFKKADFLNKDKLLAKLFQDSEKKTATYRLPTQAADGIYTGCKKCSQKKGKSHGGN